MLKNPSKFLFIFVLTLKAFVAFGSDQTEMNNFSNFQFDDHFKVSEKNLNLDVSLVGIQYFSAMGSDRAFQQKAEFAVTYKKTLSKYDFALDAFVGSYSSARSTYFSVAEIVGGIHSENEKSYLYLGRKIENLSGLDQKLNIGLYNPYFTDDYVQFRTLGLIGLHSQMQVSIFGFNASYLPLYLPNQDPQVYADNGEIKSPSRWAQKPPSEFQFGSQNREIIYTIRDYNTNDIVNNGGYTLSTYLGLSDVRPWIRLSAARKPINAIPLSRDTYGTATNFTGQVKLLPVVTYSQIRSLDINADVGIIKTTLSYLGDRPENKVAPENETLQFLEPLDIYGVSVNANWSPWLGHNLQTEISYSEVKGGEIKDLMADGRPSLFTFSAQRTLFKKPLSLSISSEVFHIQEKPVMTSLKWTYDRFYKGSLMTGAVRYEALRHMDVKVGFDVLGVEDDTPAMDHFLKLNQANDRIYAGLDYVF